MPTGNEPWPTWDHVSRGLDPVQVDHAFPHLVAGDALHHPWPHLRRDVPHTWYIDERHPTMGVLNRDEATLLHHLARRVSGGKVLEIGAWLGWSTCHLALAGVTVDVVDPAHDDPAFRTEVETALTQCGVMDRVRLHGGRSPETVEALATAGRRWDLVFIDGDHVAPGPIRDALACVPFLSPDGAVVFHDLASPDVAEGLRALQGLGFRVLVYQTAQLMGVAWRGDFAPVIHHPDPAVAWQLPVHLLDLPRSPEGAPAPAWPELPDPTTSPTRRGRICIVSNELVGPFKNGGIGTATTGLAETLADAGHQVSVLYTGAIWTPDVDLQLWRSRYRELGIDFHALTVDDLATLTGPVRDRGFAVPWLVHRWLAEREFDVVHVNDCCGDGSLALAARSLGLAHRRTPFVTTLHSPSEWVIELNETVPASLLFAAFSAGERLTTATTDIVLSPSHYLLDWATTQAFDLPERTFVQQYAIPSDRLRDDPAGEPAARIPGGPVREIVFFGRLEERKGLRTFCNALDLVADELARRQVTVTFLGRPHRCADMDALDYLALRGEAWRFPVRTLTELGQPEAIDHLHRAGTIAVMPSPADNSPCTVYEAILHEIPFLAASTGGIPEIVHPDDRAAVLFGTTHGELGEALLRALDEGGRVARLAIDQDVVRARLLALHDELLADPGPERLTPEPVRYAAAVIDHADGADLDATLESLRPCAWVQEVIVLDRTGLVEEAEHRAVIDLVRDDLHRLTHALLGLEHREVMLLHSGARADPQALARLLGAQQAARCDGLQPAAVVDTTVVPPIGSSPAFTLVEGASFTGALVARRDRLVDLATAAPPVAAAPFLGLADRLLADAVVLPHPEVVVTLPALQGRELAPPAAGRLRTYAAAGPLATYYALSSVAGGEGAAIGHRREVALTLVDAGLGPAVRIAARGLREARRVRARIATTRTGALARRARRRLR
jgi:glycosyltransferase involved in cell wall biosynthesis/predicted O-methyltransferase YrrM